MFGMTPQASIVETGETARPEKRAPIPSTCARAVTPDCVRALYNIIDYIPQATNNSIGEFILGSIIGDDF
jgi:hypothetical protein